MEIEEIRSENGIVINGLLLITPKIFRDPRGYFFESWNNKLFSKRVNKKVTFVQDNHSKSIKGVLRGLHYQTKPLAQGKLVRCVLAEIFDVAVDIRKTSKTFGKWKGVKLHAEKNQQLWIPEGFAHGFLSLSDYAEVLYKTTNYWDKDSEKSINWNDESLAINWPLREIKKNLPLLSKKDEEAISFEESLCYFD